MGKNDQNRVKQQANEQVGRNQANQVAADDTLRSILGTAQSRSSDILPKVVSGYSDIQSGGGYDPAIMGGVTQNLQEYSKTGGLTDADATAMRNRASHTARSVYDVAEDQAHRASLATGGYGDSSNAILGTLARRGSQAASEAVTASDADIARIRQSGRLAGASGLADIEQRKVGNRLAATSGLSSVYGLNEAEVQSTVDGILRNYAQTGQLNNEDLSILTNLANQPGVFDKIMSTITQLGGAAAGVMTGVGAMNP